MNYQDIEKLASLKESNELEFKERWRLYMRFSTVKVVLFFMV